MFDFLKRKTTEVADVATPVVADTTTEVITSIAVYAFLVEAAKEIASRSTELAVVERKSADDLRKEYRELVSLGLAGTQNAKVLKERLDAVDAYNENITKAEEVVAYIKRVNHCFCGKSFLVSKEKFNDVCKRNKLSVGLLTEYNGVIPSRNISEIADAKKAFAEFYEEKKEEDAETYLHRSPFSFLGVETYEIYVKEVEVEENKDASALLKYLKDNGNILRVRYHKLHGETTVYAEHFLTDIPIRNIGRFTRVKGYAIGNDTLFIACPKKYLNNADVVVTKRPVDPIVFQYCPYGVLVHSVWGEEAEDKTLREYMEFNKLV